MAKGQTGLCAKKTKHDYQEIYSFIMSDMISTGSFWKIFRCNYCKDLKLVTNKR